MTEIYDMRGKRVWVAGHRGMVGSALMRRLVTEGCSLLTVDRSQLDLRDADAVMQWVRQNRPHAIFMAAAKVGGIQANDRNPVDFLVENLQLEINVVRAAHSADVEKLIFLGSSCIYPKMAPQPIVENSLLTGSLEPTNEWYAVAKIAGIKLCQAYRKQYGSNFIAAMPTNLYGPGDNFDLHTSHVVPALIRKAHEAKISRAKSLTVWGSGKPYREFLHVDDCADAVVYLMVHYNEQEQVNVGFGDDLTIRELAALICRIVGVEADLIFDPSLPDGTPRKLLDSTKLQSMGWKPRISLEDGLRSTYEWFLTSVSQNGATVS